MNRQTIKIRDQILGIPRDRRIDKAHIYVVQTKFGQSIIVPVKPFDRAPIIPDDIQIPSHFAYLIEFIMYDKMGSLQNKINDHYKITLKKMPHHFLWPLRILSYGATYPGRKLLRVLSFEPTIYKWWYVRMLNKDEPLLIKRVKK